MSMQKAIVVIMAAATMGGCAGGGQEGPRAPEQERWLLQVQNHNWQDATVYAVTQGTRLRIGTVSTHQSERFRLPETAVRGGELRLLVDLIGSSSSYVTPPILITRGDVIEFEVENHLPMSSYLVMGYRR